MDSAAAPIISKVRWAFDLNDGNHSFASNSSSPPNADTTSSTLAFVNSQLISHGFIRAPGLQLQGLAPKDQETAAKCLTTMLGQRMDDIARSEGVSTKLRTLTYDHERLNSFYKVSEEKAAHAEREAELAKSKMNAAAKALASEQTSHKQTSANLQKSRSDNQYLRANTQNEIKRKEKEVEKILERWQKICNEQAALGSVGTGLECANLAVVNGDPPPKEDSLLEQALAELEANKSRLLEENDAFRDVVLSAARALQHMVYQLDPTTTEPPQLLSVAQLFSAAGHTSAALYDPAAQALVAHSKLKDYSASIRQRVEEIQSLAAERQAARETDRLLESEQEENKNLKRELEKATAAIVDMKEELARRSSVDIVMQQKKVIDNVLNDQRFIRKPDPEDDEAEAHEADDAATRLAALEERLNQERDEFSELAAQLEQERTVLEAERQQYLEEKRAWKLQQILSQQPDSPELRREREMEKELGPKVAVEGVEPGTGRVHQIRRSRPSLGSPTAPAVEKPVDPRPQKAAPVTAQTAASCPQARPHKSASSHAGHAKAKLQEEAPTAGPSNPALEPRADHRRKSTNPFEEVLMRSAQRPKPVFSDGKALPSFQKVAFDLPASKGFTSSESSPSEGSSSGASGGRSNSGSSGDEIKVRSSKDPSSPSKKSAPAKQRNANPTAVTPPIFTHRRVVGKKHQYTPAQPSPLRKIVTADSSTELSSSSGPEGDYSLSPTSNLLAVIAASGGRRNAGYTPKTLGKKPQAPAILAVELVDDDDDEQDAWEPVLETDPTDELQSKTPDGSPPSLPPTTSVPASPYHPPNTNPLTEDDLVMAPKLKHAPVAVRKTAPTRAPVRPAGTANLSKKPVRPPPAAPAPPPLKGKGKEKENVPQPQAAVPKPVPRVAAPSSPGRPKVVPGKVVMGRSTSKASAAVKPPAVRTAVGSAETKVGRLVPPRTRPVAPPAGVSRLRHP